MVNTIHQTIILKAVNAKYIIVVTKIIIYIYTSKILVI